MTKQFAVNPDWQTTTIQTLPKLADDDLHLWSLPLALEPHQRELALSWLNPAQRERYDKRVGERRKQAYLAGRYYIFCLLAAYSECQPHELELAYTRLNKPYLVNAHSPLHFNFTDTTIGRGETADSHALIAFSHHRQLGVDIEHTSRQNNFAAIAQNRFTHVEQEFIKDANGDINRERFMHVWTRKEASGKATGQGINFRMNQRELIQDGSAIINYEDEHQQAWRLTQIRVSPTLIGCVVHEGHAPVKLSAFNQILSS